MAEMPQVCIVGPRQLTRELLGELLRVRCGVEVRVDSRFASLEDAARRLGGMQLLVCDAEGIASRALDAFTARARARWPRLGIIRVDPLDNSDDIVRKVLACVAPVGRSTEKLTPHELDVLLAVAAGLRNSEVARRMRRSPKTVEKHRANMQRKLGLRNLAQITAFAIHNGLLSVESIIGLRRNRNHGDV